jgi:choline dehydrogenase-like flavoprotein
VFASDIIGGTAGCVIAGRLTEAFPDVSILVIEAGTDSTDDEVVARKYIAHDRGKNMLTTRSASRHVLCPHGRQDW